MKNFILSLIILFVILKLDAQEIVRIGTGNVYDFRFSSNGSLAYILNTRNIDIWDIHQRLMIKSLEGPDNTLIALDINENLNYLAASSLDSSIYLWNLRDYRLLQKVNINGIANTVVLNSKTNELICGLQDGQILFIDIYTGAILRGIKNGHSEITSIVLIDSTGLFATSGSAGMIRLWESGSPIQCDEISAHADLIREISYSYSKKQIYSCSDDGTVKEFNINNKKIEIHSKKIKWKINRSWIMSVNLNDDDAMAYASYRGKIFIISPYSKYYFHLDNKIFKVRFLIQKNPYLIVGLATNDGLKILQGSQMKIKTIR